ncbi:MazG-like family protein [Clostridium tyrobutyricum]|uniref:MazG-like family protein n=1 Tax=Clostridium tyrobutyricum TaxID=1519 RepID=UPI0030D548F8
MLNKRQEKDFERCEELSCCDCECSICAADQDNLTINELIKEAHENAVKHGFWENIDRLFITSEYGKNAVIGNLLMLVVSEVAEAQDGLRKGDTDNFKEELADVTIRLADLCGGLGIDLENEIIKKMEKNKNRPYKHGKKF